MSGRSRVVALTVALALSHATCAAADPVVTSFALTFNALDGQHVINGSTTARFDFVPLPLAELTLRHRRDELHLEGLPPVAFSYTTGSGIGATTTRLSIANATYRRGIRGGWWLGAGVTLYNQHTTYASQSGTIYTRFGTNGRPSSIYPIAGSEEQFSRVSGARFELGRGWRIGSTTLEASAALNPVLHAVQWTYVPTPAQFPCTPPACSPNPTFADPERGSQLDLGVRVARPVRSRGLFLYGLRYLHYSAHYEAEPGLLADRNLGIAPLVGYQIRL